MFALVMFVVYAVVAILGFFLACFALWLALTIAYGIILAFFQTVIAMAGAMQWLVLLPVRLVTFIARKVTRKHAS